MRRELKMLLADLGVPVPDLEVTGVEMDSRRVSPGDLFLACKGHGGARSHGLVHVEQAVARGAAAVAWEPASGWAQPEIAVPEIAVPGLSAMAGEIAARFHGRPADELFCVGITGTDGKTSTAYLLAQALERLDTRCAYIGTIGTGFVERLDKASHTTPDPVSLQRLLARLRDDGARACAMEVSSHALDQARTGGLRFRVGVLTNITRDHLDYHGTVEQYAAAKRRLFDGDASAAALVLNRDDAHGARWAQELAATKDVVVYGIDGGTPAGRYVLARNVALSPQGLSFEIDSSWGAATLRSRLLGRFNVYNLLAVLGSLMLKGVALDAAVAALAEVRTVPGRIEAYRGPRAKPLVVVDYAHTPDALRQILQAVRAHTRKRLICVFGCGGDRDRGKRPLMGAAAAELADVVVVTDDNPRSEAPEAIVIDILRGIDRSRYSRVFVQHDRAQAIREAVDVASADDVVVVAGKGHEDYQLYGRDVRDFSDRRFVAELLGASA
ncbi:MAG TPA: UDP-N-acetylmuramoyl-L-alanyl-D-glutamate--2,6-diaminopimelate ligase [Solimonas sp.]